MHAPPQAAGPAEESPEHDIQRIIIRVIENRCEISIDSSGRHLHNRGYRTEHAGTPLRETLAASLLLYAAQKRGLEAYSWITDPMCGSGTAAIEAALLALRKAPGLGRSFLFSQWPNFQDRRWAFLQRQAEENKAENGTSRPRIIGLDKDPRAIDKARRNARRAGIETLVEWAQRDFLKKGLPAHIDTGREKAGLIVIDPPYGKRSAHPGQEFYHTISDWIAHNAAEWDCLLLCPPWLRSTFRQSAAGSKSGPAEVLRFNHGGLRISLLSSID